MSIVGKTVLFTYPNYGTPDGYPKHTAHSGQKVKVLRQLKLQATGGQEMYVIEAKDGWKGDVHRDELTISEPVQISQVSFVEVSDLVPENWRDWFYETISENAPFSWGDNNRTLITAERFLDHAERVLDDDNPPITENEKEAFINQLKELGQTYVDLEN